MWAIQLRLAHPDEGPKLKALMTAFGYNYLDLMDFSELTPDWVFAEHEGELVGSIQVILSKPVGQVQGLAVDPNLTHRRRAQVVKVLMDQTSVTFGAANINLATFFVAHKRKDFKRLLKRRGVIVAATGNLMIGQPATWRG